MTEQEARQAIKGRLIFGNDLQICAIRFLDAVQEAVDAIKESPECEECNGWGVVEEDCKLCRDGEDCFGECKDGRVEVDCIPCGGLGYFVTDWPACKADVMKAARSRIEEERFRR